MKRKTAVSETWSAKEALDLRILTYMPLVPLITEHIGRQMDRPLNLGELAKEGVRGLIEAASSYAAQSRVPFRIYVKNHIRGAVLDGLVAGSSSSRSHLSERRRLPHFPQMWSGMPGFATGEHQRSDEFLLSLFELQRSLEHSVETAQRAKRSEIHASSQTRK
jgi:hypothetical protein